MQIRAGKSLTSMVRVGEIFTAYKFLNIIIIIKMEKIRVTLCKNAAGALYIVNNTYKTSYWRCYSILYTKIATLTQEILFVNAAVFVCMK